MELDWAESLSATDVPGFWSVKGFKVTVMRLMMFKVMYREALIRFTLFESQLRSSVDYDATCGRLLNWRSSAHQPPHVVMVSVSATKEGSSVAEKFVWLVMTICSRVCRIG